MFRHHIIALTIFLSVTAFHSNSQTTLTVGNTILELDTVANGLDVPWEIQFGADGFLWTTERKGLVSRVDLNSKARQTVLDITGQVFQQSEAGLLGLALHPDFNSNKQVFIVYTYGSHPEVKERLVKYFFNGTTLVSPQILVDNIKGSVAHNGSRLFFMDDKTLLMSTGDGLESNLAQDFNLNNGKILRLNSDGSIPGDNPFPGKYIYSAGHRNPQGIVKAPGGRIFISEHGPATDDEFQELLKGRNYGWPDVEGFCDLPEEAVFCQQFSVKEPLLDWTPTIAPSDMVYYENPAFPEFDKSFLLTTLKAKTLVVVKLDAVFNSSVSATGYLSNMFGRLRDICTGPENEIYLATNGASEANIDPGTHVIIRLRPPVAPVAISKNGPVNTIKVFADPATKEIVLVRDPGYVGLLQVKLTAISGETIYCEEVGGDTARVVLGHPMPGLYILEVMLEEQLVSRKLIPF